MCAWITIIYYMEYILYIIILGLFQCLCLLRCCMSDGGPSMFGKHVGGEVCANDNVSCQNKVCIYR